MNKNLFSFLLTRSEYLGNKPYTLRLFRYFQYLPVVKLILRNKMKPEIVKVMNNSVNKKNLLKLRTYIRNKQ